MYYYREYSYPAWDPYNRDGMGPQNSSSNPDREDLDSTKILIGIAICELNCNLLYLKGIQVRIAEDKMFSIRS